MPRRLPRPAVRRLRGYAFDPSLSTRMDTALVNEIVFRVPWEDASTGLQPGPIGEYVEVIDIDPASECAYAPVDLDDPAILAEDGLTPSESNPQFHQQMVYAVVMTTIRTFELALGRPVLWGVGPSEGGFRFVQRLRIYPHAFRGANAYFSPKKRALLFGYFPATRETQKDHFPGGMVFTCLSHDIVAHETAHAILHGEHRCWSEPTNPDVLAFHEAFADIVALFQHFTFPSVLEFEIARHRGDLAGGTALAQLAQQFGRALGQHAALRDYIQREPDPTLLGRTLEPHARGAILVAAVFDAFRAIYRRRVEDLIRIATRGSGVLEDGELHPALVRRLAAEAAKAARHVLTMCVRALDYCPPVDMEFGEYLRAIVTGDVDHVPTDDLGYRVAFIEAFRRHGIYPRGIRTMSVDTLCWRRVMPTLTEAEEEQLTEDVRALASSLRRAVHDVEKALISHDEVRAPGGTERSRRERYHALMDQLGGKFHEMLEGEDARLFKLVTGRALVLAPDPEVDLETGTDGRPKFNVESVRFARRSGPDGDRVNHAVVVVQQKRAEERAPRLRGGCTLIFDLDTLTLRYAIGKPLDSARVPALDDRRTAAMSAISGAYGPELRDETFGMLHRSADGGKL